MLFPTAPMEQNTSSLSYLAQSSFGDGARLFSCGQRQPSASSSPRLQLQNSVASTPPGSLCTAGSHPLVPSATKMTARKDSTCGNDLGLEFILTHITLSLEQHKSEIISHIQELRQAQEDLVAKFQNNLGDGKRNRRISAESKRSSLASTTTTETKITSLKNKETLVAGGGLHQKVKPLLLVDHVDSKDLVESSAEHVEDDSEVTHGQVHSRRPSAQYFDSHVENAKHTLCAPLLKRRSRRKSISKLHSVLLEPVVHSPWFDGFVGVLIALNTAYMGYAAQYSLEHYNQDVDDTSFFEGVTTFFNTCFTMELVLRILAVGFGQFFRGLDRYWNVMDTFIVSATLLYTLASYLETSSSLISPSIFRVLRLIRIVRIIKVAKMAYFLHELRNLVASLAGGMRILFWSIILLAIIYYTFSMIVLTAIADKMSVPSTDPDWVQSILKKYGSITRAMLTLYMATTGGIDWSAAADPLMTLGVGYYVGYLFFNAFVSMALLNVILGSFVDATMKASLRDYVQEMQDEADDFHMYRESVVDLILTFDEDSDGLMDMNELQRSFSYPAMQSFLRHIGYHTYEAETLYRAMEQATHGQVYIESFVDACLRLGRQSKSLDMLLVTDQLHLVQETLFSILDEHKRLRHRRA